MRLNDKKLFIKLSLIYALIHLCLYIPVHITYQEWFSTAPAGVKTAFGIIISLLSEVARFALPVFAATVIYISYIYGSFTRSVLRILFFSLPYLISFFPENYILNLSVTDSVGALLASLGSSLLSVFIVSLEVFVLFGIMYFFSRPPKIDRQSSSAAISISENAMFDFSVPFTKSLFMASLLRFVISLISVIADTVSYAVKYAGGYRTSEILTIVFTFVFTVVLWIATYTVVYELKCVLIKKRLVPEAEEII